jgi:DNA-directed RNA polymerase subunit F
MSTIGTKRKIIDLKPETEKNLRLIAVNYGQNLKSYIESVLDEIANEDAVLIALSNVPEANEILTKSEKTDFINSLKL